MLLKFKDKWQKPTDCSHCKKDVNYHTLYITGYFVLIIIMMFTFEAVKEDGVNDRPFYNYFSFASVIVSIILAVVTIIYSFYTNSRSSGQIETLNNAAKDVSKATRSYSNSANDLHTNIHRIIEAVGRLELKTDKFFDKSFESGNKSQNTIRDSDPNQYVKNYVLLSSPFGIMAMYACVLSYDTKKEFSLSLFGDEKFRLYVGGFLISTGAAGIISNTINFDTSTVSCINIDDTLKDSLSEWMNNNPENVLVTELKPSIDNYFNVPEHKL